MNVLHLYRTYFPDTNGGLEQAIRQIAMATEKRGINNCVFALSPKPSPKCLEIDEIRVIQSRSWLAPASCDIGGIASFRRFAELSNWADVIHFHFPWPFADVLNLLIHPKKYKVMTYHSDIVRQRVLGTLYFPLMRYTFFDMNAVVATSPAYAQTSKLFSRCLPAERLRMIPLGIEETSYPSQDDDKVLQRLGLLNGEPFVLFIGVLRYYKGLHTLLDASVHVQGRIVIAGSGPEEDALRMQASNLGLHNVIFAGQVTDMEKVSLLRACRALVLPSYLRSEAFGMVLVEASMFGKPMISCEIGTGTSFVNQHEETGYVVTPQDPIALANALNRLLTDKELAQRFGSAARRRYDTLFSGMALGRAYSELYHEVLLG